MSDLAVHFGKTMLADKLALVHDYLIGVSAEKASGLVFLEYDLIVLNEDLDRVLGFDIHFVAKLDWKYDPSKLIDPAYDSCAFHCFVSLFCINPCKGLVE